MLLFRASPERFSRGATRNLLLILALVGALLVHPEVRRAAPARLFESRCRCLFRSAAVHSADPGAAGARLPQAGSTPLCRTAAFVGAGFSPARRALSLIFVGATLGSPARLPESRGLCSAESRSSETLRLLPLWPKSIRTHSGVAFSLDFLITLWYTITSAGIPAVQ